MTVLFTDDYAQMSKAAFGLALDAFYAKPRLLVCAASGNSPLQLYSLLADMAGKSPGLFAQARVIALDEWVGLSEYKAGSCKAFLEERLTGPLAISPERFIHFEAESQDAAAECRRIDDYLDREGPIDLCILGLGLNGHLGFNEPATELSVQSHLATLSETSRQHSMLDGTESKPAQGFTLGMAQILHSKKIILLVSGHSKTGAAARLLERRIYTQFPASLLWLHPNATCIMDKDAKQSTQLNG